MSDALTQAREAARRPVNAFVRSDACPVGMKMMTHGTVYFALCQQVQDAILAAEKRGMERALDDVQRNLSAVQYDPAPYTAMKYKLDQMRNVRKTAISDTSEGVKSKPDQKFPIRDGGA